MINKMKKILLIMLLTFTSMTYADEGRYTTVAEPNSENIWVTDTEVGKVRRCWYSDIRHKISCTPWKGISD